MHLVVSLVGGLYGVAFYLATVVLVAGLVRKIGRYATTPAPLRIATTPAPLSRGGVAVRMAGEVLLFASLFKSDKWLWMFGALFHGALALVLLRHLRYFTEPVWGWVVALQPLGIAAGFALVLGLGGLWGRRLAVERIRYISRPSDHLMLLLLAAIVLSGLTLKYVARTDIVALKEFIIGLLTLDWRPLPADPLVLIHLGLVVVLMAVLPFSKLLHIPGIFFSPTLNQIDDPRERRRVAPWAADPNARRRG